jgi:hypothetical protein
MSNNTFLCLIISAYIPGVSGIQNGRHLTLSLYLQRIIKSKDTEYSAF